MPRKRAEPEAPAEPSLPAAPLPDADFDRLFDADFFDDVDAAPVDAPTVETFETAPMVKEDTSRAAAAVVPFRPVLAFRRALVPAALFVLGSLVPSNAALKILPVFARGPIQALLRFLVGARHTTPGPLGLVRVATA